MPSGGQQYCAVAAADGFAYHSKLVVWHSTGGKGPKGEQGALQDSCLACSRDGDWIYDRDVGLEVQLQWNLLDFGLHLVKEVGIDQQRVCFITAVVLPCTYRAVGSLLHSHLQRLTCLESVRECMCYARWKYCL